MRIQQRNGRKSLTTVQGLKKEYSYNKILKDLKKEFCCNGTVVQDPELGQVCCHSLVKMWMHFNIPFLVLLLLDFFFTIDEYGSSVDFISCDAFFLCPRFLQILELY